MKPLIKTLALLTAGVGAVAVVKRVSKNKKFLESKIDAVNGKAVEALSLATEAKLLVTENLGTIQI